MTNDAPEAASAAAQPADQWTDQPAGTTQIVLSAVAEELAAEAEWHRGRKLQRAGHVDELRAQIAAAQATNAEMAGKMAEMAQALAAGMMEADDGA